MHRLESGTDGAAQADKQSNTTHTVYDACRNDTAIELYTVGKADHEWISIARFQHATKAGLPRNAIVLDATAPLSRVVDTIVVSIS